MLDYNLIKYKAVSVLYIFYTCVDTTGMPHLKIR
jgi:hypothetical protein